MKLKPIRLGLVDSITYTILVAAVFFLVLSWKQNTLGPAWASLGCFIVAVVFRVIFWRCPACGKYLWRNRTYTCQHCNARLEK